MLFKEVIPHSSDPRIKDLVIPWVCCYSIASVVSAVSLLLKSRAFRDQIRSRREQFELEEADKGAQKLQTHRKRYIHTKRTIVMIYGSMMVGLAECAPLGTLQIMLALRFGMSLVGITVYRHSVFYMH